MQTTCLASQQQILPSSKKQFKTKLILAFMSAHIPLFKLRNPQIISLFADLGQAVPWETVCRDYVHQLAETETRCIQQITRDKKALLIVDESEFDNKTTTTRFILTRLFSQCTGVNLAYGLPTTFSSTLICHKHLPYKVPSFSYLLSTLFSNSSWLPFTPSSSTCSVSILFIQHNSSLLSTWPNHLSLFHRMTSPMSSIASMLLTHSLLFLSLKLTPVIHLNILISLLCIFLISSIFVGHVSLPYNIAGLMHVV